MKEDLFKQVLAIMVVLGCFAYFFIKGLDPALVAVLAAVVYFFFGSSASSQKKDATIASMSAQQPVK